MDDYHLERRAQKVSAEVDEAITDLIDYAETLESVVTDLEKKLEEHEKNNQQLADSLEEALHDLQQSELERLELVQLIKRFNNVDI